MIFSFPAEGLEKFVLKPACSGRSPFHLSELIIKGGLKSRQYLF
jgi:hypothetical protein